MSITTVELQKKESDIIKELATIRRIEEDNQHRRKSLFIEWADVLEKKIEAGLIVLKKTEIADFMAKNIVTHGGTIGEVQYMYQCLPFEYKTSQCVKAVASAEFHNQHLNNKWISPLSKCLTEGQNATIEYALEFDTMHMHNRALQDLKIKIDKLQQKYAEELEDRGIKMPDDTVPQSWERELELSNKFSQKYSIDKPKPKEGYFYQALVDFREVIDACAKKAKEYSGEKVDENGNVIMPEISEEQDKAFAKSIYALCSLLAPFIDDKWRRDWFEWHKIIKDRLEYSLHGAMSKSKLPTLMASALRGVTREQIDAKVPIAYKHYKQLAEDLPGLYAIHEFYMKRQQKFLGDLTIRMKEKMSFLS